MSHSLAGCQISAVATFIFPLQKASLLVVMKCTRYTKRVIRCMNNKILQSFYAVTAISDFYSYMPVNQSVIVKSYLEYVKHVLN